MTASIAFLADYATLLEEWSLLLENFSADIWVFFKGSLVKASSTVIALNQAICKESSGLTKILVLIVLLFAASLTHILKQILRARTTLRSAYVSLDASFSVDKKPLYTWILISSLNSACNWPLRLL